MESFTQGYRLRQEDLNFHLFARYNYNQQYLTFPYTPYWLRYDLGFIREDNNQFYPIGAKNRIPDILSTGTFRPNFIIGDRWAPGTYEIRWNYRDSSLSNIETQIVQFSVVSEGVYQPLLSMYNHYDIVAFFTLVD